MSAKGATITTDQFAKLLKFLETWGGRDKTVCAQIERLLLHHRSRCEEKERRLYMMTFENCYQ
jgi:hypothetical protein